LDWAFDEWKKPEIFIKLAKKYKQNKFLMIVPPPMNKLKYYDEIIKEIKKLNNITYCKFIPNNMVLKLLQQSRIYCLTSDMEGDWPMVVLEAAAVGTPILSLFINYDFLIDKYHGGIFCNNNLNLFYKNFETLIKNPAKLQKLSKNAHKYIIDNHDINKNVDNLINSII